MTEDPSLKLPDIHSEVEYLSPSVQQQWLYNRQILSFMIQDVTRQSVDIWIKGIMRAGAKWNPEKPFLIYYELQAVPLTPYLRQRAIEITKMSMHLHGRTATVLPQHLGAPLLRIFMEYDLRRIRSNIVQRVFYKRDYAMEWLLEAITG